MSLFTSNLFNKLYFYFLSFNLSLPTLSSHLTSFFHGSPFITTMGTTTILCCLHTTITPTPKKPLPGILYLETLTLSPMTLTTPLPPQLSPTTDGFPLNLTSPPSSFHLTIILPRNHHL